jgi:transposase InsO family protein
MADEDVVVEVRDARADHCREHEVGVQFGPQTECGSPHRTADCFGLGIGEVGQIGHVAARLYKQVPEHRRAGLVDGAMRDQHEFAFPHLRPDQWTLTPVLGADPALSFRMLRRDHGRTVTPLRRRVTTKGWVYLATVIDCHTKAVVGWAVDDNYRTPLISAAIRMAARNHGLAPGAVFHSDRGSNYTSAEFAAVLTGLDIRQSVGRTGICYDNAMAESFFAALKTERVHRTQYPTRGHARRDIARYIEFHYNTKRLHSALGYKTPQEVHDEYRNRQAAA